MTMGPFKAKGYRAKEVLDLVHTYLCGPIAPVQEEAMSTSSLSLTTTQDMDTYT